MIKKALSILLAVCFLASIVSCKVTKNGATPAPVKTDAPATDAPASSQDPATEAPDYSQSPTTAVPYIKSEADEAFEALSNEMFISIATADGFTYHQFIKDPSSYGIDETEVELGWGSHTFEALEEDRNENDELLEKLAAIDCAQLNPINANAYDTITETLRLGNLLTDYYYYGEPLETLNGSHTTIPLMMTMYEIDDRRDLDGYMYLLEDMPRYFGEIEAFEVQKAEKGLFMTENALDTVLESIQKFIDSGEDCFLIDFLDGVLKDGVEGVSEEDAKAYSERSRACVMNGILPAYSKLKKTLEGLRGKCGRFVGAAERSEEAKECFVASIKNAAACEMEAFEMEELLSDTAETLINKLFEVIASDANLLNSFGGDITSGDADTDIAYLLELIKNIYPSIPEQKIDYVTIPDALAEDFSPAAYLISAFDDSSRNIVIKNPTADTRTLLLTMAHECFPGHLYQTQYFRNGTFPLAQQIAEPTGYSEGWAVFSELIIASRAEKYGVSACLLEQYNSIVCNIIIPAYISLRVNCDGWDKTQIGSYLEPFGLNEEAYIDIAYEYAVNMPDYFFNYAMGFANTYRIYHHVEPKTDEELKAFFTDYLSVGPCCYEVLFKHFGIEH